MFKDLTEGKNVMEGIYVHFNVVGNHRERKISGKEETNFYALPSYSYFHFHFSN
jgi:hypothetical protein